jgi:hypothetical protein
MEVALGALIVIAWFAVVFWGAVILILEAKRKNDWDKVSIAVLSAMTVAGPLLTLMPEHVIFGIHTIGLGFVLAVISAFVIAVSAWTKWGS